VKEDYLPYAFRGTWDKYLCYLLSVDVDSAFEQIVPYYQKPLHDFLLSLGEKNETDIEDMIQVSFLRAYRNLKFSERGKDFFAEFQLKPWLFKIATNVFLQRFRDYSLGKESFLDESEEALEIIDHHFMQPEAAIELQETMEKVKVGIEVLPEPSRTILQLHFFEDLSYAAIAMRLGMRLATVRSHIHRGRKMLRKFVEEQ
jgi:RNA polymerase sigma-70 factor (ECF subfamily)